MQAAVFAVATLDAIMSANGELMLLAAAAIGEGLAAHGSDSELMRATGRNLQHALHHSFPLFAVGRYATKVLPDQ